MATYQVQELSFIDNRLVQPGEVIEYAGKPGKALSLVKADRKGGAATGSKSNSGAADNPGDGTDTNLV